ncbi:helix-turn-helix domain-containing protein [Sphaerisporangium corydalis]|uniref:Scr1 family TA system antitoxin-like transcriptional regulator n=1 Tax=Sphaerisporangium corydalis TaxID=1441875 RepID=A0ABV9E996_9ACTN|nr:helix-turn-helix transcriptional regulator [Sphaerisporangium corydalis]
MTANEMDSGLKSPLARFGAEMRFYRKNAGLSQARVGERLGCSQDLISQIELAKRNPSHDHAEKLDQIFGLTEKNYFMGLYRRIVAPAGGPLYHVRWVEEVESRAGVLRSWDPLLAPGLLQVESYARQIFRRAPMISSTEMDRRLTERMRRKLVLDRQEPPVTVLALLDEGILYRPVGTPEIMREQLDYFLEVSAWPNVTIQVVPISAGCTPGLISQFAIAEGLPGHEPDIVYAESAAQGLITADEAIVAQVRGRYDAIRADALPQSASLTIIEEAREHWTRRI